jgi:hypothetical protein
LEHENGSASGVWRFIRSLEEKTCRIYHLTHAWTKTTGRSAS